MKTHSRKLFPVLLSRLPLAVVAAAALAGRPAIGATDFWVGGFGGNNWNNGANWFSGSPPNPADSLVFTNQTGAAETSSNDFVPGTEFDGITFGSSAPGSPFVLDGNSILLSGQADAITIGITNGTALTETVSNDIILDWGDYTFNGGPGTLAMDGTITPDTGGAACFGSGVTSASLTTDASGLISGLGGAGLMINSSGGVSVLATVSGGNIVGYTFPASAQIASGTVPTNGISGTNIDLTATATATYTFPASPDAVLYDGSIEVDNSASKTTISWGSASHSTNLVIGIPGNIGAIYTPNTTTTQGITVGQGNGSYLTAGPMSGAAVPGEVIFAINGSNTKNEAENDANIVDNASGGHVTVVKTGTGSMYFDVTNGYSGGTYVDQGYLQINTATGLAAC